MAVIPLTVSRNRWAFALGVLSMSSPALAEDEPLPWEHRATVGVSGGANGNLESDEGLSVAATVDGWVDVILWPFLSFRLRGGFGRHPVDAGGYSEARFDGATRWVVSLAPAVAVSGFIGLGWAQTDFDLVVRGDGDVERERSRSALQMPVGVGASFVVLPRWLTIDLRTELVPTLLEGGDATTPIRAIRSGQLTELEPRGALSLSVRQSVGLGVMF